MILNAMETDRWPRLLAIELTAKNTGRYEEWINLSTTRRVVDKLLHSINDLESRRWMGGAHCVSDLHSLINIGPRLKSVEIRTIQLGKRQLQSSLLPIPKKIPRHIRFKFRNRRIKATAGTITLARIRLTENCEELTTTNSYLYGTYKFEKTSIIFIISIEVPKVKTLNLYVIRSFSFYFPNAKVVFVCWFHFVPVGFS